MGKIYTGQDYLRLNFDVETDITGYSAVAINVLLPDGTTTTWTPTVSDATEGTMYYDIASTSILAQEGRYEMQPVVTNASGKVGPCKTVHEYVYARYK